MRPMDPEAYIDPRTVPPRHVCAQGVALIADATEGRFILGLGVSHQPVNRALAIEMEDPPSTQRRFVTAVESTHHRVLTARIGMRPDQIERLEGWERDLAFNFS